MESIVAQSVPSEDVDYTEFVIGQIEDSGGSWCITSTDGKNRECFLKHPMFQPEAGMLYRIFGYWNLRRGLIVGDHIVFYRTPAENAKTILDACRPSGHRNVADILNHSEFI